MDLTGSVGVETRATFTVNNVFLFEVGINSVLFIGDLPNTSAHVIDVKIGPECHEYDRAN